VCAKAILTPTSSGHTAHMIARYRPQARLVALVENETTCRRLALVWGVYPRRAPRGRNTDELIRTAIGKAQEAGFVGPGDRVVVTAGVPSGVAGRTNLIKVEVVGDHEGV
jgi:pyruvate kinase